MGWICPAERSDLICDDLIRQRINGIGLHPDAHPLLSTAVELTTLHVYTCCRGNGDQGKYRQLATLWGRDLQLIVQVGSQRMACAGEVLPTPALEYVVSRLSIVFISMAVYSATFVF